MSGIAKELAKRIVQNVEQVIVGKEAVIESLCISLLCNGHVLLEDVPGTGKTTLAKALAVSVGCDFKRVQFTPDLLPSDVTGVNIYSPKQEEFRLKQGPVFTHVLLADEINRATPRTQSSLLECMEERQVTIDGVTYPLPSPFLVIATQNPIETQGTFPLPEAQLDRFLMRLSLGYPAAEYEAEMLNAFAQANPLAKLSAIANEDELRAAQAETGGVKAGKAVREYIVALVNATRQAPSVRLGVSPRGALALLHAAQAHAALQGRDYLLPDDVKAVAGDVLTHRILCRGSGVLRQSDASGAVVKQALEAVPVPLE